MRSEKYLKLSKKRTSVKPKLHPENLDKNFVFTGLLGRGLRKWLPRKRNSKELSKGSIGEK